MFYENGTQYDQSMILNADFSLNRTALEREGVPWFATSNASECLSPSSVASIIAGPLLSGPGTVADSSLLFFAHSLRELTR